MTYEFSYNILLLRNIHYTTAKYIKVTQKANNKGKDL